MEHIAQVSQLNLEAGDILDVLNWKDIPESVQEFVGRLRGRYTFFDDLYNFKRGLQKISPTTSAESYYCNLFLGIVYYYLVDEKPGNKGIALKCIQKAIAETRNHITDSEKQSLVLRMLVSVKHRLTRLDRIVFLIDSNYDGEVSFESVRRHYGKYVTSVWVSKFDESKFDRALRTYNQLFIFAHGDETGTFLGEKQIEPDWLIDKLNYPDKCVDVLGLFSCQENLSESQVRNKVDYFLTDSYLSNAHINEMFTYGYIQNYVKSHIVVDSFDIGRLGPIFRANSNPGLELYEGGTRIRN